MKETGGGSFLTEGGTKGRYIKLTLNFTGIIYLPSLERCASKIAIL